MVRYILLTLRVRKTLTMTGELDILPRLPDMFFEWLTIMIRFNIVSRSW